MKFLVYANCQANPLSIIIERLFLDLHREPISPIHLLDRKAPKKVHETISGVDVVVHQPISDVYNDLSISAIKSKFPDKIYISFPSIYFDGYFPNSMYLRKPGGGVLEGVFGAYHDKRVIQGYLQNRSVEEVQELMLDTGRSQNILKSIDESLGRLRFKESESHVNVKLSCFIREELFSKRLFMVFNHPTNKVLKHVAIQVGKNLKLDKISEEGLVFVDKRKDYLNGLQEPIDSSIIGMMENLNEDDDKYVITKDRETHTYTLKKYLKEQFEIYRNTKDLEQIYNFAIMRKRSLGM